MNALDALLKADFNIKKEVYIARLDTHFEVRALSADEVESIHEQATYFVGKGVNRKKERDKVKLGYLTIAKGTVNPDLNDNQLKEKAGASSAWEVVKALLLPGEQQKLEQEILIASGFSDDEAEEESYEEIKN
ncbi:phage tail assembly chaperone [Paenisporosarcina sp. NPDC076898]|uniref:phage tail assembly chaperone n=1 Tax=unclassified Paenisporosarcina TaxID=2642018 RepID=UPI003D06B738